MEPEDGVAEGDDDELELAPVALSEIVVVSEEDSGEESVPLVVVGDSGPLVACVVPAVREVPVLMLVLLVELVLEVRVALLPELADGIRVYLEAPPAVGGYAVVAPVALVDTRFPLSSRKMPRPFSQHLSSSSQQRLPSGQVPTLGNRPPSSAAQDI